MSALSASPEGASSSSASASASASASRPVFYTSQEDGGKTSSENLAESGKRNAQIHYHPQAGRIFYQDEPEEGGRWLVPHQRDHRLVAQRRRKKMKNALPSLLLQQKLEEREEEKERQQQEALEMEAAKMRPNPAQLSKQKTVYQRPSSMGGTLPGRWSNFIDEEQDLDAFHGRTRNAQNQSSALGNSDGGDGAGGDYGSGPWRSRMLHTAPIGTRHSSQNASSRASVSGPRDGSGGDGGGGGFMVQRWVDEDDGAGSGDLSPRRAEAKRSHNFGGYSSPKSNAVDELTDHRLGGRASVYRGYLHASKKRDAEYENRLKQSVALLRELRQQMNPGPVDNAYEKMLTHRVSLSLLDIERYATLLFLTSPDTSLLVAEHSIAGPAEEASGRGDRVSATSPQWDEPEDDNNATNSSTGSILGELEVDQILAAVSARPPIDPTKEVDASHDSSAVVSGKKSSHAQAPWDPLQFDWQEGGKSKEQDKEKPLSFVDPHDAAHFLSTEHVLAFLSQLNAAGCMAESVHELLLIIQAVVAVFGSAVSLDEPIVVNSSFSLASSKNQSRRKKMNSGDSNTCKSGKAVRSEGDRPSPFQLQLDFLELQSPPETEDEARRQYHMYVEEMARLELAVKTAAPFPLGCPIDAIYRSGLSASSSGGAAAGADKPEPTESDDYLKKLSDYLKSPSSRLAIPILEGQLDPELIASTVLSPTFPFLPQPPSAATPNSSPEALVEFLESRDAICMAAPLDTLSVFQAFDAFPLGFASPNDLVAGLLAVQRFYLHLCGQRMAHFALVRSQLDGFFHAREFEELERQEAKHQEFLARLAELDAMAQAEIDDLLARLPADMQQELKELLDSKEAGDADAANGQVGTLEMSDDPMLQVYRQRIIDARHGIVSRKEALERGEKDFLDEIEQKLDNVGTIFDDLSEADDDGVDPMNHDDDMFDMMDMGFNEDPKDSGLRITERMRWTAAHALGSSSLFEFVEHTLVVDQAKLDRLLNAAGGLQPLLDLIDAWHSKEWYFLKFDDLVAAVSNPGGEMDHQQRKHKILQEAQRFVPPTEDELFELGNRLVESSLFDDNKDNLSSEDIVTMESLVELFEGSNRLPIGPVNSRIDKFIAQGRRFNNMNELSGAIRAKRAWNISTKSKAAAAQMFARSVTGVGSQGLLGQLQMSQAVPEGDEAAAAAEESVLEEPDSKEEDVGELPDLSELEEIPSDLDTQMQLPTESNLDDANAQPELEVKQEPICDEEPPAKESEIPSKHSDTAADLPSSSVDKKPASLDVSSISAEPDAAPAASPRTPSGKSQERKAQRKILLKYLSGQECKLFSSTSETLSVTKSEVKLLLSKVTPAHQAEPLIERLKALDAAGVRFMSFQEMVRAMIREKDQELIASASSSNAAAAAPASSAQIESSPSAEPSPAPAAPAASASTGSKEPSRIRSRDVKAVVAYLSNHEQCHLFADVVEPLQVTKEGIKTLIATAEGSAQTTIDWLRKMDRLQRRFASLGKLQLAMKIAIKKGVVGNKKERQALVGHLSRISIFSNTTEQLQVTGPDLDLLLLAGGGAEGAERIIDALDAENVKCMTFHELVEIAQKRGGWPTPESQ